MPQFETALALHQQGELDQALQIYEGILAVNPLHYGSLHYLGLIKLQKGDLTESISLLKKAISLNRSEPDALSNLAFAENLAGDHTSARQHSSAALQIRPGDTQALTNRGNALLGLKQFHLAEIDFREALKAAPNNPKYLYNLGISLLYQTRYLEALNCLKHALKADPYMFETHLNIGVVYEKLDDLSNSLQHLEYATKINPKSLAALNNKGNVQRKLGRLADAEISYKKALELNSSHSETFLNLSNLYFEMGDDEAAFISCKKSIELSANYANAWNTLGNLLSRANDHLDGLAAYTQATSLEPSNSSFWLNRSNAEYQLRNIQAALSSCNKCIELDQSKADAYTHKGNIYSRIRDYQRAEQNYQRAYLIDQDANYRLSSLIGARLRMCDWSNFDADKEKLRIQIVKKAVASNPFISQWIYDDPELLHNIAQEHVQLTTNRSKRRSVYRPPVRADVEKIRIGYFSPDFREHAVSFLTAEIFELHDRSRFEIFGFKTVPHKDDAVTRRIAAAFDRFDDISKVSDTKVSEWCKDLGLHIAVDLCGHTSGARLGLFERGVAPIQISYIGYLGTIGGQLFDYIIADPTLISKAERVYFSESILYLPWYQANDRQRPRPIKSNFREAHQIRADEVVFCCINNSYKINPTMFQVWMNILRATKNTRLCLYTENLWAKSNLTNELTRRGVPQERVIFLEATARHDYLASYLDMDLFLDTHPYNAGTTASDSLWMGCPVLTLRGESFQSRIAASLLVAAGAPELIERSLQGYEDTAIRLATDRSRLAKLREKITERSASCNLFNTSKFTRNLETGYQLCFDRYKNNLVKSDVKVPPDRELI